MAKIGLICFHKNLGQNPTQWITDFRDSVDAQTNQNFIIFELNYGGGIERIFINSVFYSSELSNHAEAQNYLFSHVFDYGCDYAFNTNVDDTYSPDRIEKQLPYLDAGYDIVSSNFSLFNDEGIFHTHEFDKLDIKKELAKNHNVICHPVVAMSKNFWRSNRYYPHEIPTEDLQLWKRSINSFRFIILPEVLCYHREHPNGVGRTKK